MTCTKKKLSYFHIVHLIAFISYEISFHTSSCNSSFVQCPRTHQWFCYNKLRKLLSKTTRLAKIDIILMSNATREMQLCF